MQLILKQSYCAEPIEPGDIIRPGIVDVKAMSRDAEGDPDEYGPRVTVARFAIDHLDIFRGQASGWSLGDICDSDSQGWLDVYDALFDETGEVRKGIVEDDQIYQVVFLHRAVFHPDVDSLRAYLLTHLAELFSSDAILVAWDHELGLHPVALIEIGFQRIPRTGLVVRENSRITLYQADDDRQRAETFLAATDSTKTIRREWKQASKPGDDS